MYTRTYIHTCIHTYMDINININACIYIHLGHGEEGFIAEQTTCVGSVLVGLF
jgi:hypothetical protein